MQEFLIQAVLLMAIKQWFAVVMYASLSIGKVSLDTVLLWLTHAYVKEGLL